MSQAESLRAEAEARAAGQAASRERENAKLEADKARAQAKERERQAKITDLITGHDKVLADHNQNKTPNIAKIAAADFKLNGARLGGAATSFSSSSHSSSSSSYASVGPRWMPDEETDSCTKCKVDFDWFVRRHHCRHCGVIFCDKCSRQRCLLPASFRQRDPQRVCESCFEALAPHQESSTGVIANHQKVNSLDLISNRRYMNLPFALTLGSEIRKAAYSIHNMFTSEWIEDKAIPKRLFTEAKGLAFLTVVKGGFVVAPRIGTGLVMARLPDGSWSAPAAIGTVGCNWGALVGAEVTDYVIVLNTPEAVSTFSGIGQVNVGANLELAIGPIGRSAEGSVSMTDKVFAPCVAYAHSRGLYAGVALEGAVVVARPDVNFKFYGRPLEPLEILSGTVDPPRACLPLYDALTHHTGAPCPASFSHMSSLAAASEDNPLVTGFTRVSSSALGGMIS
jgi:SH3 domain-containing YSC84-like protein 1